MLFNSLEFLAFLPTVFLLYWFVFRTRRWQNLLIVAASYVFYGWWDWHFLVLIVFTSLCSYASGLLLERCEGHPGVRCWISGANIVLNLGILGVFKYYNFFVENLEALLATVGYRPDWVTLSVVLPVGISFYTFQALSYSIDVYRGTIRPTHNLVEFLAYISFFPQLVAGPIERATNLLPQFQQRRTFRYAEAVDGCRQMLWGMVKKVVVADNCALAVNLIWASHDTASALLLLLGGVLFTFQIYCDFSGYSDIAIGTARLFGFRLMRNFRYPYFAMGMADFWRRWHISLMTWLRDYIYIPLGGSRRGRWRTVRNTWVVFAASGLWHGANWTFIVWGLYHALLVSVESMMGRRKGTDAADATLTLLSRLTTLTRWAATFALAVVGWIIFRSETLSQAWTYLRRMCRVGTLTDVASVTAGKQALLWGVAVLAVEWWQRDRQHALQFPPNGPWRWAAVRWATYYALILLLLCCHGEQSEFIYFQF